MSRGWAKASACRLQINLFCAFLCHIVSLQYLSRSSLHRLAGLPCRIFLSYGLQMVTREVHRSSLRRLICPAQEHFIFLTVLIISMTFVLSLTQILVFPSLYVMLPNFFPVWYVRPQVCSVLVWSLHHIKKGKGMVLYSAVSSPLDRSKRFTLSSPGRPVHSDTVLGFSWKHSSHAAIAQRLFNHISTTVYSQVLIYTAESTEAS